MLEGQGAVPVLPLLSLVHLKKVWSIEPEGEENGEETLDRFSEQPSHR